MAIALLVGSPRGVRRFFAAFSLVALMVPPKGVLATVMVVPREKPPAVADGIQARALMLYDCQADYLDMVRGWSEEKREWCCGRSGVACRKATEAQSKATSVNADFNCNEGLSNWGREWSVGKKAWCCQQEGKGCPAALRGLLRVGAGGLTGAPAAPPEPRHEFWEHDCEADRDDWERAWPEHKMKWCCRHSAVGCEGSRGESSAQPARADPKPFNCDAFPTWKVEWSDAKKDWCCEHHGQACTAYDCGADLGDWDLAWSPSKKQWCCRHESRGCYAGGAAIAAKAEESVLSFDCKAAADAWQVEWSDAKMHYCCKHGGRGCSEALPVLPVLPVLPKLPQYNCAADVDVWFQAWSAQKQRFCCAQQEHGCKVPAHPMQAMNFDYDCQAALGNWEEEWSKQKKAWCCKNDSLGCPSIAV